MRRLFDGAHSVLLYFFVGNRSDLIKPAFQTSVEQVIDKQGNTAHISEVNATKDREKQTNRLKRNRRKKN